MTTNTLPEISTLWKQDDPAASQTAFMELLSAAESTGNHAYLVMLLTQVARAQGLQKNFEAANASLDRARKLLDGNDPQQMRTAMVSYLLERGRIYRSSGYEDRAEDYFLEAYEMGLDAGETAMAIDAAHMLGLVLSGSESTDWFERALKHSSMGINPHARAWEVPLTELLGRIHAEEGDTETAKRMLSDAAKRRSASGNAVAATTMKCSGVSCSCPESLSDGSLMVV